MSFENLCGKLLNNPKDAPMFALMLRTSLLPFAASALFWRFSWTFALVYLSVYVVVLLPPFVTMYHDTCHQRLFRRRYDMLNKYLDWVLAPLLGFTPETYYVHHIGMHHPEENLAADVSTTLPYRRDSMRAFARYWVRFFFAYFEMAGYFRRTHRTKLSKRFVIGELAYIGVVGLACVVNPAATVVVFLIPLFIGRTVLIIGNWGEHAFIDPNAPDNPYRASLNLIGDRVNRRCFNVGYHIGHHLRPRLHFSEMPEDFQNNLAAYAREDAIVLEDMHYPTVWFHLMTKNYRKLARAYMRLPGAPQRTESEVIQLLRSRTVPIHSA